MTMPLDVDLHKLMEYSCVLSKRGLFIEMRIAYFALGQKEYKKLLQYTLKIFIIRVIKLSLNLKCINYELKNKV